MSRKGVEMLQDDIKSILNEYPEILYGYTSITYSKFAQDYKSAFVFAVPYGKQLTLKTYKETDFESGIMQAKDVINKVVAKIETILKTQSIKYFIPPVAQKSEEELLAPFSFKYAAVNAGLGWIGRNDVVITEKYGPRVRLSAILIDENFTYAEGITESKCPKDCNLCVQVCPHNALKGETWNLKKLRTELIDYHLCNEMRSKYISTHGRKNSCGLCLAVCPYGINMG